MIFGIPIFLIGVIIFWFTNKKLITKLLWTLIPIIAWYPLMIFTYWTSGTIGTELTQKKDFIIPNGFSGTIKVVESKCGEKPIEKNGRLQFVIPNNGIYLFNGELKSGYVNEKYYVKNKKGELTEIPIKFKLTDENEKDTTGVEKIIGVFSGSYGTYGDDKSNFISAYLETNKNYSEKEKWKKEKEQDKIIDSLRAICK